MSALEDFVDALNTDDRLALVRNILFAAGLGLIVYGLVLALGGDRRAGESESLWLWLPGWAITLVWLVLLAFMGAARWLLNSYTIIGAGQARGLVTLLILVCLLWPFLSLIPGSPSLAFATNIFVLLLAVATLLIVRLPSRDAAYLLVPLIAWLLFLLPVIFSATGPA